MKNFKSDDKTSNRPSDTITTHVARYENMLPVGDPAYYFTNSEKSATTCERFWFYEYSRGYHTDGVGTSLTYGVILHRLLEDILSVVQEYNIPHCLPLLDDCYKILSANLHDYIEEQQEHINEYDANFESELLLRLTNSLQGWHDNFSKILEEWDIVAVELPIYKDVTLSTGETTASFNTVYLPTSTGGLTRLAQLGEANNMQGFYEIVLNESDYDLMGYTDDIDLRLDLDKIEMRKIELPVRFLGKIDVLLQHKEDEKRLAVLDHKTTASCDRYESRARYDTQLPTYASVVNSMIKQGKLNTVPEGAKVDTLIYDLISNKIGAAPTPLKSGKLSSRVSCPSYLFEEAIESLKLEKKDYTEKLEELRDNDSKFFRTIERDFLSDDDFVIRSEIAATADFLVDKHQKLSATNNASRSNIYRHVRRNSGQCDRFGRCKFSAICLANNTKSAILKTRSKIYWTHN